MRKRTKRIGLMVAMVLSLMMGSAEWSQAIEVRSGSGNADGDFKVMFEPVKPVYKTGERIQFRVRGSKTFYLYLFSVDTRENRGYVLLPNALQQYHKYSAKKEYLVPEKNVEFYSEQPGTEKIIMLASTKKLDIRMEKYTKSGNFFTSEASEVEEEVKSLSIRSRKKKAQKVSTEISLVIIGEGERSRTAPPPQERAPRGISAFVSSDRTDYRAGDTMKISFGADKKGFVYLFSVEPDGRRTLLKKQAVSGREFYQVRAEAALPAGEHSLVVMYDEQGDLNKNSAKLPDFSGGTKEIRLIDDRPEAYAVYHLRIHQ